MGAIFQPVVALPADDEIPRFGDRGQGERVAPLANRVGATRGDVAEAPLQAGERFVVFALADAQSAHRLRRFADARFDFEIQAIGRELDRVLLRAAARQQAGHAAPRRARPSPRARYW